MIIWIKLIIYTYACGYFIIIRKNEIDLNLTKRDYMKSRMLLGRDAMKGEVIIDPQHKYLHGKLSDSEIESKYKNKKKK